MHDLMDGIYENNDYTYKRPERQPKYSKDYDNADYSPKPKKE